MNDILIRDALLDDAEAISQLFRARVGVWQRMGVSGQVENVPYDDLTLYERWTHGGPWMSVETGSVLLSRLLRGVGLAVVAEIGGEIAGFVEAYHGHEPAPFGQHIHVGQLIYPSDRPAIAEGLLRHLLELVETMDDARLTACISSPDSPAGRIFRDLGMEPLQSVQRYTVPARTGQGLYRVNEHFNSSAAQIEGWTMPIGRTESARLHWEAAWPRIWEVIPQIAAQRVHRLQLVASSYEAFVYCRRDPYDPRSAEVLCWSQKPLAAQLLTAIRDWAHRESYRSLRLVVPQEMVKMLGPDAEAEPFTRQIYGVRP